MATPTHSAFFYGTLMAPQVLHRVCHGSTSPSNPIYAAHQFTISPAILHNYRRHRVRHADYPAILPVAPTDPDSSQATVRGTYVTGLTATDLWRLDIFEGSEYRRERVRVRVLTQANLTGSGEGGDRGEEVDAETYVWIADPQDLDEREWDFSEFQREKMRFWVGSEGAGEYAEVDDAVASAEQQRDGTGGRGANGHISMALAEEQGKDGVKKDVV
ncbi:hypothetical protein LTR35_002701 [Friedmanniomyces endolithicus]|uniref:Putative gamma-glutamylcyclotransferase n=1 Tax=Friedmanniomyces endolithicus TaxID=329885 RepID=A0AAN6G2F4_9PEZI|nr:hypothetical protein LTS00_009966 [Friedmanniomyces endolithicus]KAK0289504.1 hypothetical protein LTR35_002701 [Friedmanniomyces endolithicus]KAK0328722.1 hypothetical protein LTR82_000654 [Friedmanniomyces endolithicus]KAK1019583.1 hypothetical protein LTR54_000225 [Friedmanniomyces endolithicus]